MVNDKGIFPDKVHLRRQFEYGKWLRDGQAAYFLKKSTRMKMKRNLKGLFEAQYARTGWSRGGG